MNTINNMAAPVQIMALWTNGHHFADGIFKYIFMNENFCISIRISSKFVHKGPIDNIPALV